MRARYINLSLLYNGCGLDGQVYNEVNKDGVVIKLHVTLVINN